MFSVAHKWAQETEEGSRLYKHFVPTVLLARNLLLHHRSFNRIAVTFMDLLLSHYCGHG